MILFRPPLRRAVDQIGAITITDMPEGWFRALGGCVAARTTTRNRAVARSPKLKTRLMETHAGTPAHSRAQAPPRLSAIFFRYTEAAPSPPPPPRLSASIPALHPRRAASPMPFKVSSSTPRVSISGRARATLFLRYLSQIPRVGAYVGRSDNTHMSQRLYTRFTEVSNLARA